MTREELIIKLKSKRESLIGHKFRNAIHPLLLSTMKKMRNFDLVPVGKTNENKKILEETLKTGPVIYAFNHSNVHDVPTAGEIISEHAYLLASDEVRGKLDGFLFELMGVVWVKRTKDDTKKVIEQNPKDHMLKLLSENESLKTYPERTWNVTDNEIILPFKWGITSVSMKSKRPIIPIIMDMDYKENACYYNIGLPIYIKEDMDLKESNENVRDAMATLRYEIWEEKDKKRKEDPEHLTGKEYRDIAEIEFKLYKEALKKEYPSFNEEEEAKMIYRPYATKEEAFKHLEKIKPSLNTAFLYGKNKHM